MRKRYIYLLLFAIPGFFISLIIGALATGMVFGFFWFFVFGDGVWRIPIDKIILIAFPLTFLAAWIGIIVVGFHVGKKNEQSQTLNKKHIFISLGLSIIFVLIIIFRLGVFGQKTGNEICQSFCAQKEYTSSSLDKQTTCVCFDWLGKEAIRVPFSEINTTK